MTKVLVIEDETSLRVEILDTLSFEGFEVVGAEDGRVGVELAREHLPDLILCDIMMPKLDGLGVLRVLRDDPITAMIPFIFLTAKASRADIRKGMESGADDYLTKPFTSAELLNAVRVRLEKQAALVIGYEQRLEDLREVIVRNLPHEFRTPLTSILAYSELLSMDFDSFAPEKAREMLEGIHKAGMRLWRLIENYLLYAQIEMLAMAPERLAALRALRVEKPGKLVEVATFKKTERAGRSADLVLEVEEAAAPVAVSEDNLEKIVEELVDNACKFSDAETPVRVKTVTEDDAFSLSITNSGHGMTTEEIDSIGAYMQFDRKLHEQQGAGLGLVIAKRLTELHGGRLAIASVPGQQTTVRVTFAQAEPEA